MMEDALRYLRAALSPGAVGYEGPFYSLEAVAIAPAPQGPLGLVVGGVGDINTPRLAGLFADEFNVYPGPSFASGVASREPARQPKKPVVIRMQFC